MSSSYRDLFVTAGDGLRLYARDYAPGACALLPVIGLPGLARTSADFHELAESISRDPARPRRFVSLDYRGRGRSEWDPDWRSYDVKVELNDTVQVLAAAGIAKAIFVGTSRGGLIAMAIGAAHPELVAGAILNDVGPVLEAEGLKRIRSYVGKLPTPRTIDEAADILRRQSETQFPHYTREQWERMARGTWRETEDGLVLAYDPRLTKALEGLDLEAALPDLWPLFETLKLFPVLAIRGANSDLLSAETLRMMKERHPDLTSITVPDQGHAPALEGDLVREIKDFIAKVDAG
ncbi:alpha/beta fold hydrolase [Microvirga lotononidis]|uniref:Putative hydrolase or acyltransferase of alpha/beta superfamily n=1 Tax=Microvirga lotononidis TaxID=864069 RepID=I4YWG0_9HYPH|nr:alpha/beta hydrolase [Microvirga lotononidis]EIM28302.1 putative hydrolase or acyltransferase of alpha/beta superfamily [Microvirga lotononidis]WQO27605.1 alpha/beta hydrolase [Microvirga lotononidis]